ncbi:DNA internalization-related competence protein ComEC/Rec2 [Legionella sp. km772]|uniref:DNA internalization-related competence protein ComEC/Rec2 n=1 Tax=Legionella sp. km772 TaxID=2498111 RepID=UPI000F8D9155|nr:DNA internalization-related competence protein ComEC/Rec2 [Legionella sp. km772]RUR06994.1 DNA internalization-related competence protein ComEC/Rec2 [Legionella sp. km772]
MEIFCFFIGILYFYTLNNYLILSALILFYLTPKRRLVLFLLLGVLLALIHQWWQAPINLPNTDPCVVLLEGTVVSLPVKSKDKTQFIYLIKKINQHKAHALIQLAWYNNPSLQIHAGEEWQFNAKIKKPRNFRNPGSYDYVTSLQIKHIAWVGYVIPKHSHLIKSSASASWLSWREQLSQQLAGLINNPHHLGIIEALTLNISSHLSQEDWTLFRRTGTTHLFGISGEHIALLSGLFFWFFRKLWSQNAAFCVLIPAPAIAGLLSFVLAFLYACLAGFAPPVQRALIGCFFYSFSYLGLQRLTPWQVWRYALLAVLCIEPHAVFMQGFYFSFLAVVCLLITHQRWRHRGYKGNLALQLSCLIGLMPLSLYWFSYASINGFIANLFAIPLVGFIIVPLSLILLCISSFSWSWLIATPLNWSINLLMMGLKGVQYFDQLNISWGLTSIELTLPLLGALLLFVLLPIKPFRSLALLWLLLPFFPAKEVINAGEALIQVLDVGQGLAVSIRTKHHVLLYDTGDQYFQGSDLGAMVILPFYEYLGIKKIDALVVSHPDKDHLGGLKSIEASLPIDQFIVNNPNYYHRGRNCHDYAPWDWDGIHFRFFPILKQFKGKNNNSCILQISSSKNSLLLTGDIEQEAEDYLVSTFGSQLKSTLLLLAHHGSKTSSSYRFLFEAAPQAAIASLGFANRFHFPHGKTLATLKALNIAFYRTDECGMVTIKLSANKPGESVECFAKQ